KNLKNLGLAAIQYSDDKRFFPHSIAVSKLAGGIESDEAAFAARLLIRFDYALPEDFVCPATADDRAAEQPRLVPLLAATDISYGYTRRGLTTGSMSTNLVFADRSRRVPELADMALRDGPLRGNHRSCMAAVHLDAHTVRITPTSNPVTTRTIAGTKPGPPREDGYLGVLPD
ncbi:MAG: hypothetical protein ACAI25_16530, partial [Planctomycetota bacterium]